MIPGTIQKWVTVERLIAFLGLLVTGYQIHVAVSIIFGGLGIAGLLARALYVIGRRRLVYLIKQHGKRKIAYW